jgi:hypothetical protein
MQLCSKYVQYCKEEMLDIANVEEMLDENEDVRVGCLMESLYELYKHIVMERKDICLPKPESGFLNLMGKERYDPRAIKEWHNQAVVDGGKQNP